MIYRWKRISVFRSWPVKGSASRLTRSVRHFRLSYRVSAGANRGLYTDTYLYRLVQITRSTATFFPNLRHRNAVCIRYPSREEIASDNRHPSYRTFNICPRCTLLTSLGQLGESFIDRSLSPSLAVFVFFTRLHSGSRKFEILR